MNFIFDTTESIELIFDMFYVYEKLRNNKKYSSCNKKYLYHYYKKGLKIEHVCDKIKKIWSNKMAKTYVYLVRLLDKKYKDIDELLQKSLKFLKDEFFDCDGIILENDIYSCVHIFQYLTNKTFNEYIDEMISSLEFIENFKNIIKTLISTSPENKNLGQCYKQIYDRINNYNVSYRIFYDNPDIYFSYMIPKYIIMKSNKFIIDDIIGVGSYGCVVKYTNFQNDILCVKIYFNQNDDKEIMGMINQNSELNNIMINSLYVDKYDVVIENNLLGTKYIDRTSPNKKNHYLFMEYAKQFDLKSIEMDYQNYQDVKFNFVIICKIIEKVIKLIDYGIYFTDLKLGNILYLENKDDVRFIDFDSFYFLKRGSKVIFSYIDLISHLIPIKNDKIYMSRDNLYMLEKIMVLKLAILTLELFCYNTNSIEKQNFEITWLNFIDRRIIKYTNERNAKILKKMFSGQRDNIPNLRDVYIVFLDILTNISLT